MFYLDTSLLVTALSNESQTVQAQRWLAEQASRGLVTSQWTVSEFASALALKRRIGHLQQDDVEATQHLWHLLRRKSLVVHPVEAKDFDRAAELVFLSRTALKAGDALHLAVIERIGAILASRDKGMIEAAMSLGIVAVLL